MAMTPTSCSPYISGYRASGRSLNARKTASSAPLTAPPDTIRETTTKAIRPTSATAPHVRVSREYRSSPAVR